MTTSTSTAINKINQTQNRQKSQENQWILAGKGKKRQTAKAYQEISKQNTETSKNLNSAQACRTSTLKPTPVTDSDSSSNDVKQPATCKSSTTKDRNKNINLQHRAVLIYDNHFNNFRNGFFTRNFDVETIKIGRASDKATITKAKNREKLDRCEVVFLHVGSKDVKLKKDTKSILDTVNSLVLEVLKITKAQVCVSTPIRDTSSTKLEALESNLYDLCDRANSYRDRLTIANLYTIGSFIRINSKGDQILTLLGEARLYLKVKDYIYIALGYNPPNDGPYQSYRRKISHNE